MSRQQECTHNHPQDEAEHQSEELMLHRRMGDIGQKLLVLSGKGGVGKSTVAANLAVSLANKGKSVGLLDVDVHGPSIPKLLGLNAQKLSPDSSGGIRPVQVAQNLKVVSVGFLLDSARDPVIWRGPMKHNVIRQFLKDVVWGRLDYLVIDSPPGTGDEPLSVAQLVGDRAAAVVVTTPQDLAISDVRRCLSFCSALSLRVLGIVENMSGFACPNCGVRIDLFKTGGGRRLAAEMNVPLLGRIPIDPDIVTAGDAGRPFIDQHTKGASAKAFAGVVQQILGSGAQPEAKTDTEEPRKESASMKIAIPLVQGRLSMHFGHCEQFAIVEVDVEEKKVLNTDTLTPPLHEPGALPRWLHEQGANVILAGGMGQRAQHLFAQNDIAVVVGAPAEAPHDLAIAYLNGTLQSGNNICDH